MDKETISFRLDTDKKIALDLIAESMDRDRTFVLNEAVVAYLNYYKIEEQEIKARLQRVKAGDVATNQEVQDAFSKWKK